MVFMVQNSFHNEESTDEDPLYNTPLYPIHNCSLSHSSFAELEITGQILAVQSALKGYLHRSTQFWPILNLYLTN